MPKQYAKTKKETKKSQMDNKKEKRGEKIVTNNFIFLGRPGSGKGTYSTKVAKELNIPHISTGDVFRENIKNQTELGKQVQQIVKEGKLVSDEVVNKIAKNRLEEPDCQNGFILDGYPRTIQQAKMLDEYKTIDKVLNIDVPEEIIIRRITTRRTCKKCGAIYNTLSLKPKQEGICDKCGGKLYQRADDTEEAVKIRLQAYEELTQPLIKYYENKGILKTVKWEKSLIPEGEIDIPIQTMLEKILEILKQ